MSKIIYIEKHIKDHPRTQRILKHWGDKATVIECDHYGEIFNLKAQNFRLQKNNPALILAKKNGKFVLPTPEGFGIGGQQNYYFSHMLNCLYDCRYCFLQGMYRSAHHVCFVNYEDFMQEITAVANQTPGKNSYFFSGYDCDSLASESVTHFLKEFLPFFKTQPNAILELRTKSSNVRELLRHEPFKNCVVAFSFTPEAISKAVENKVPSVAKRIEAMRAVAEHGWQVGLRFDPLIYADNFNELYQQLITDVMQQLPSHALHSVSVGPMRFPAKMYQQLSKLYPKDKLLAHPLHKRDNTVSYRADLEAQMKQFVLTELKKHIDQTLIFECSPL